MYFIPVITNGTFLASITPVFNVTWPFRNQSNMLIWCLRNIYYYYYKKKNKKEKKKLYTEQLFFKCKYLEIFTNI